MGPWSHGPMALGPMAHGPMGPWSHGPLLPPALINPCVNKVWSMYGPVTLGNAHNEVAARINHQIADRWCVGGEGTFINKGWGLYVVVRLGLRQIT